LLFEGDAAALDEAAALLLPAAVVDTAGEELAAAEDFTADTEEIAEDALLTNDDALLEIELATELPAEDAEEIADADEALTLELLWRSDANDGSVTPNDAQS